MSPPFERNGIDASGEKPGASTVSVHKEVFSYEGLVVTSVMEAAAFSLSAVDHGLDDSASPLCCLLYRSDHPHQRRGYAAASGQVPLSQAE